jgi:hypothetical protein
MVRLFRAPFLSGEPEDFNFGAVLNRCLGAIQNRAGGLLGKIILTAVIADLGGHSFENDSRLASLESCDDFTGVGLPLSANNALHDSLLVRKSGCQMAGSGT